MAKEVGEVKGDSIRFFVGYSGWGSGQLEEELEQGTWIVTKTDSSDIIDLDPDFRGILVRIYRLIY